MRVVIRLIQCLIPCFLSLHVRGNTSNLTVRLSLLVFFMTLSTNDNLNVFLINMVSKIQQAFDLSVEAHIFQFIVLISTIESGITSIASAYNPQICHKHSYYLVFGMLQEKKFTTNIQGRRETCLGTFNYTSQYIAVSKSKHIYCRVSQKSVW